MFKFFNTILNIGVLQRTSDPYFRNHLRETKRLVMPTPESCSVLNQIFCESKCLGFACKQIEVHRRAYGVTCQIL